MHVHSSPVRAGLALRRSWKVRACRRAWGLALLAGLPGPTSAQAQGTADAPAISGLAASAARSLRVERIAFEGRNALDEATLQDITQPFLGRGLRYDDLEELRQRLIRAYVERGYVSSGALLDRFDAKSGLLQVRLIDGRVSQVQVRGAGRLSDRYLAQRLVRQGEVFQVQVLEDRYRTLLVDPLFSRLQTRRTLVRRSRRRWRWPRCATTRRWLNCERSSNFTRAR